jgi:hypothetical protein
MGGGVAAIAGGKFLASHTGHFTPREELLIR